MRASTTRLLLHRIGIAFFLATLACARDNRSGGRVDTVAVRLRAQAHAESVYTSSTTTLADSLSEHASAHSAGVVDSGSRLHTRLTAVALKIADSVARLNALPVQLTNALIRVFPPYTPAQEKQLVHLRAIELAQRDAAGEAEREAARRAYTRIAENNMLDAGHDIRVTVQGEHATTLRLEYVLAGRVFARRLSQQTGLFTTWQTMGFRDLYLSDGYDFETHWNLNPP